MILQGSIERFGLANVLQFLAQNMATGVLEVRDFEEHGAIYLVKGRVEAISLPVTDERLGVHLLRGGALSEEQLARVLMEHSENGGLSGRKALGQRLVERGFVSEMTVREAMRRLTVTRMFELAHWQSGVFSYEEPEEMPQFHIAIEGDVQELLLITQKRIDEGYRPRKRAQQKAGDLCAGCPVADCTPEIKARHLKKDVCLWRKMSAVMNEPAERFGTAGPVRVAGTSGEGETPDVGLAGLLESCVTTAGGSAPVLEEAYRPY
jgi:hypothetical protein